MLGMLGDKKKMLAGILAIAKEKSPSKFEKELDGNVKEVEVDEDVSIKDQIMACAEKLIMAVKQEDVEAVAKSYFQLHEAVAEAIDQGVGLEESDESDEFEDDME